MMIIKIPNIDMNHDVENMRVKFRIRAVARASNVSLFWFLAFLFWSPWLGNVQVTTSSLYSATVRGFAVFFLIVSPKSAVTLVDSYFFKCKCKANEISKGARGCSMATRARA